jgi:glycosyltransferase involved in cell wall biosynthesis
LADHFVIGYSGNLGRAHDFETLLAAIQMTERDNVRLEGPSIRWLFIGGGHAFECVKKEAAHRGLRSVVFRPYQPRHLLSQSLSVADVHIVTLRPELEGLIVPSKFYGVAAAGRPVLFIGARGGEIARLTKHHTCGISIANGDAAALADAVRDLAHDPRRLLKMGECAREACERFYDKSLAIDAWTRMLRTISDTARTHDPMRPAPDIHSDRSKIFAAATPVRRPRRLPFARIWRRT